MQESLGAFQKLPMVMPSIDLYSSALRKSKRVQPTKGCTLIPFFTHSFLQTLELSLYLFWQALLILQSEKGIEVLNSLMHS